MNAIQIGNNVTDIMKLPCVYSCHKMANGELEYLLYDWDENGQYVRAHKGDWLCEDYQGEQPIINGEKIKEWVLKKCPTLKYDNFTICF